MPSCHLTVPYFKNEVKRHILIEVGWIQSFTKIPRKPQKTLQGAEAFSRKEESAQEYGFPYFSVFYPSYSTSVTVKLKSD